MRGRGYVGQFSRNSMGRDRHSNPRYPRSTLPGSCSLFKQASNSILGSHPFSLTLTVFRFTFLFVSSFPPPVSRPLVFPGFSFAPPRYPSFCGSRAYRIRLSFRPSLSFEALPTQIREWYSGISTVAITTWISPVLQAVTAQSFHCNYLLVSVAPPPYANVAARVG